MIARRPSDEAANHADPRRLLGQALELGEITFEESGLLDQVARRVSGDGELREDDQFRTGIAGAGGKGDHLPDVSVEVAYGRIDLSQRQFHLGSIIASPAIIPAA